MNNKVYEWKRCYGSVKIDGLMDKSTSRLLSAMAAAERCFTHDLNYILSKATYRRYRRGKNRCVRCGVEL